MQRYHLVLYRYLFGTLQVLIMTMSAYEFEQQILVAIKTVQYLYRLTLQVNTTDYRLFSNHSDDPRRLC